MFRKKNAAVRIGKRHSSRACPTDGQISPPSPPIDPDSDVISAESFGGSDGDLDYAELAENSPTRSVNTPDFEGHIRKLETMHEVSEGEIDTIVQPIMIFSHTDELKIPELSDNKTKQPETLQEKYATPPVDTQT